MKGNRETTGYKHDGYAFKKPIFKSIANKISEGW